MDGDRPDLSIVNMHDAKTNLSRLVEQAVLGKPFLIAQAGRPLVKVAALDDPPSTGKRRFGFLSGQIAVPTATDRVGDAEIAALFGGDG